MPAPWTLPPEPSVVVTGASSGIGEATAYRFARARARVGLIARRAERLATVAERVRELGGQAKVAVVDVSDETEAKAAIADIENAFSGIDVLVNNAGFGLYAPLQSVRRQDVERVFAVNTFGALSCIQAVLPGMRRRGRGLIVNVSSVVGKRALPMTGAYAATKYALQGLSDALRIELAGTGIRVSVVCPGYTATEFSDNVIDYGAARSRPRGGVMTAEEVAEAIFDCARRPRREIVLTGKGRLVVFLQRFAPAVADWVIGRAVRVELPQAGCGETNLQPARAERAQPGGSGRAEGAMPRGSGRPPRAEPSAEAEREARSDEPRGWGPAAMTTSEGSEPSEERGEH